MSVIDLLNEANEHGALLYLKDGKLAIKAKKGALAPELKGRIVAEKTAIIEYLQHLESVNEQLVMPEVGVVDRNQPIKPSFAQQRLWFLDQLGGSLQYNLTGRFMLSGQLNLDAFERAANLLIERHEVLRTCFVADGDDVYQQINHKAKLALQFDDLTSKAQQQQQLQRLIEQQGQQPFDLSSDLMLRLAVATLSDNQHVIYYTMHHIAGDGWSKGILQQELGHLYQACVNNQAPSLAPLAVQYADYAHWQRQWLEGQVLEKALDYWTTQLADLPQVHNLPLDKPRPSKQRFSGHLHQQRLTLDLAAKIGQFNRTENTTLFMFMHAALSVLVSRCSGERDVVVGTAISGRALREFEPLIGFFINDLAIRTVLDAEQSFAQLLSNHKTTILDAYAHQYVPFEMLVEKLNPQRSMSHSPLYQIKLDVQNNAKNALSLEGMDTVDVENGLKPGEQFTDSDTEYSLKNDIHLNVIEDGFGILLQWRFNTDLFHDQTIANWSDSFVKLLEQVTEQQQQPLLAIDLLSPAEKQLVLEFGQGEPAKQGQLPFNHHLFAEQAQRYPQRPAVISDEQTLSYQQLDTQSNQLAHYLRAKEVGQQAIVGLCVERSVELLIGILGILKAGAAYLPIDPQLPPERIDYMLEDSGAQWVVTHSDIMMELEFEGRRVLPIDERYRQSLLAKMPDSMPQFDQQLSDLAYLIYTSGSTGQPKGVMVSHQGISTYCDYAKDSYYQVDLAGSLVATSFSFDLTAPSLYLPLICGDAVHLLSQGRDLESLALQLTQATQPYLLRLTPSHITGLIQLLADQPLADLPHAFIIGGEALATHVSQQLQQLLPAARLYNHYGPSEAVIGCCIYPIAAGVDLPQLYCPIGKPMRDTQLLVLNEKLQLCPPGVTGQLYIGGGGLAVGYIEQPQLNQEKFITNPHAQQPNQIMYQSGDLVQWQPDGQLMYVGRADDQVKVRGRRIELGEIDRALATVEDVKDCVVTVWENATGQRLVAYVVTAEDLQQDLEDEAELVRRKDLLIQQYRKHLAASLPEYMVPQIYLFIEQLPLSATGKLDRKALPEPQEADLVKSFYVAPRNETEAQVCLLWQQVLQLTQIGVDDDFFLLGGHSLLATRLINLVRDKFGIELGLRILFETPTVADMAKALDEVEENTLVLPPIEVVSREQALPLSFAQRRLWFIDKLGEGSRQYNVSGQLFVEGQYQAADFSHGVAALIERHEVLRTCFIDVDGEPLQKIVTEFDAPCEFLDVSEQTLSPQALEQVVGQKVRALFDQGFDLTQDLMFRVLVVKLAPQQFGVFYAMHHIAADGWSKGIVEQELRAFISSQPETLSELKIQYADFAFWQRQWLQGEVLDSQLNYWGDKLEGIPTVHQLPLDRSRPKYQRYDGKVLHQKLNGEVKKRISHACKEYAVTPFMLLQTAFAVLIGRYSGQKDVVIGTPVAGRTHGDVEPLIGIFINTLVLRTDLSGNLQFSQLLKRNKQTIVDAFANQHMPFELLVDKLCPERNLSHGPLVQLSFVMQNNEKDLIAERALNSASEDGLLSATDSLTVKYELELAVTEMADGWQLDWAYQGAIFDRVTIEAMANNFAVLLSNLLEQMSRGPAMEVGIDTVGLLSEQQQHWLVEQNATDCEFAADKTVAQLFQTQVEKTPDLVAIADHQQSLSYAQLNLRANRLAHQLLSLGVGLDQPIGLMIERSVEMSVAIWAILKAGACYVPLPADYPLDRLNYMIENSGLEHVIVGDNIAIAEQLAAHITQIKVKAGVNSAVNQGHDHNPSTDASSDNLAYIIYTSGSTGRPKGVAVEHRALVNRLDWMQKQYQLEHHDKVLQKTPYSFDVSVWELIWPHLHGAQLFMAKPDGHKDVDYLSAVIGEQQISFLHFVPSMLSVFIGTNGWRGCAGVRQVVCSGEALTGQLHQQFVSATSEAQVQLDNLYGPTEAAIDVSHWRCPSSAGTGATGLVKIPIGKPIQNIQLHVVDEHLQPVAIGCAGELLIGGVGLARGYINQAGLSGERFITDHLSGVEGARLYRTGDLVRFGHDGNIDYLGRIDQQLKIRGQRIELGEIEAVLAAVEGIGDVVVAPFGNQQLAAYYVLKEQTITDVQDPSNQDTSEQLAQQQLEQAAKAKLLEHMHPVAYRCLDALPLTHNGKVDRKALPKIEVKKQQYVAPRNELERQLCQLYADMLNLEQVGIEDDFFKLGGHSLLATRLVSAIRQQLSLELPIRALFEAPTVIDLVGWIETFQSDLQASAFKLPDLVKIERNQSLPLSYAQQRMWFIDQLGQGSAEYNMPGHCLFSGEFNEPALRAALRALFQRHEILRTRYVSHDGDVEQQIVTDFALPLTIYDLSLLSQEERVQQVQWLKNKNDASVFDLSRDLILRLALIKITDQQQLLLYSLHHIAGDGWSMGILAQELEALYYAHCRGSEANLPSLAVQYADFAIWQRQWLQGDVLEHHLDYWREHLAGIAPVHSLPLDKPRPAKQQFRGHSFKQRLDADITASLKQQCTAHGVTLFMLLETAFSVLISRYSNSKDIVIGSPIAGRTHADLDNLIGLFVNSIVLRTDLSGNLSFSQLLANNKKTILDAYEHQHVPFEMLVEEIRPDRDMSYNSLFQILFVVQNTEHDVAGVEGAFDGDVNKGLSEVKEVNIRFDIAVHVAEVDNQLLVVWSYRDSLFFDDTIKNMADNYQHLLQGIVEQLQSDEPSCGIEHLPMLAPKQQQQLLTQYNANVADFPTDYCVHQLFEQQVEIDPDKVAIICEDQQLSYGQLNHQANQLARHLIAKGVTPDTLVALSVERSIDAMVALYGILKSGAAYVPIDPQYPPSRYDYMLKDSGASIIISQQELLELQDVASQDVVYIDNQQYQTAVAQLSGDNIPLAQLQLTPNHMAYMIYTSGSTGLPKGVVVNHHSVVNFLYSAEALFMTDDIDGSIVSSALTFDATVQSLYLPLMAGKFVELLPDDEMLFSAMNDYLMDDDSNLIFKLTPTHLKGMAAQSVVAENPEARHVLVVAGEQLTRETLQPWFAQRLPNCRFINEYGPTECTVGSCTYEITALDFPTASRSVPIGKPMHNVRFYVLDEHMQLVPSGVIGQLYIGGAGLAREYLNQPSMTARRFIDDPFAEGNGRMYQTGDLVRWLPSGDIEFIGRVDHQIKIRGFRVELGEIEAVLEEQPQLSAAVVSVDEKDDDTQLVAYVCPDGDYLKACASEYNAEHVEQWTVVNDDKYSDSLAQEGLDEDNFTGWNSSYCSGQIEQQQMQQWVENTVAEILALKPKNLLEIGCGGGLLLYRYAMQCDSVYGMDISSVALAGVQRELDKRGMDHVRLRPGDALSLDHLVGQNFDTVVINSVAQYFPNQLYLEQVIEKLLPCMAPGGQIFFGDVRNLDLFSAHLAAIEQSQLNQSSNVKTLSSRVQRRIQQEPELLISPSFFAQLPGRYASLSDVDIMVKRGVGDNELLRYRYDVVIRKADQQASQHRIDDKSADQNSPLPWFKFESFEQLKGRLQIGAESRFGIYGLINTRVSDDLKLATGLTQWQPERLIYPLKKPGTLSEQAMAQMAQLDQLLSYAQQQGYRAKMTWSQDKLNGLELIFCREGITPVQSKGGYSRSYVTNFPQMARVAQQLSGQLQQSLQHQLPDYMAPALYIAMEQLPLTPSGKVDKKALPKPQESDLQRSEYVAPSTDVEQQLCEIWQSLLNLEQVGVNDDFFALGGHSLLATRLISAIRQSFSVELPLRVLFEAPTVAQLALSLDSQGETFVLPDVTVVERNEPLPLSYAQQRLWFIDQLGGGSAQYNMPSRQLISGEFDDGAFERAVNTLLQRHEVLRTHFIAVDGNPLQVIKTDYSADYQKVDLSDLDQEQKTEAVKGYIAQQSEKPFDLSADLMLKVVVLKLSATEHLVLYTTHHIASDGWSVGIMRNELSALYNAYRQGQQSPLAPLAVQYADYAQWQRSWMQDDVVEDALNYWKGQLANIPVIHQLPLDKPRPAQPANRGLVYRQVIDSQLTSRIRQLCNEYEVTPFIMLQSAFALLLGRFSDCDDIVIGTPIAGRTHVDIEPLIGFFINTLVLRTRLVAGQSFAELLLANKKMILDAYAHQHIPFETLVDELLPERDMSHNPLTQVLFAMQNMERGFLDLSEQQRDEISSDDAHEQLRRNNIKFDMEVNVHEVADVLTVSWGFDADLFDLATIEQYAAAYEQLLLNIDDSLSRGLIGAGNVEDGDYHYYNYLERPIANTEGYSFAQQRIARMVELAQSGAEHNGFNLFRAYGLGDKVNVEAMMQALEYVINRQQIFAATEVAITQVTVADESELTHLIEQQCQTSLNQTSLNQIPHNNDKPLSSFTLCRQQHIGHYSLLLCWHQLVADSNSFNLFIRQVDQSYRAYCRAIEPQLPALKRQYRDYALAERTAGSSENHHQQVIESQQQALEKLRSHLTGMPALLRLPLDYPRSEKQQYQAKVAITTIDRALYIRLSALSQELGAPLSLTLMSALAVLLGRYGQCDDLCIGFEVDERLKGGDDKLIGNFVNYLPLRFKLAKTMIFEQVVGQAKERLQVVLDAQAMPFESLLEVLDQRVSQAHGPMLQVSFAMHNERRIPALADDLQLDVISDNFSVDNQLPRSSGLDLAMVIDESLAGAKAMLSYNASLFNSSSIDTLLARWLGLLESIAGANALAIAGLKLPELTIRHLPLEACKTNEEVDNDEVNSSETQQPSEPLWLSMLDTYCQHHSDQLVIDDLSFAQLQQRALNLMPALAAANGSVVAVQLPAGADLVVAMYAIFKAGGQLLLLPSQQPSLRHQYLIERSNCQWLISATAAESLVCTNRIMLDALDDNDSSAEIIINSNTTTDDGNENHIDAETIVMHQYISDASGQLHPVMVSHQALSKALTQENNTVAEQFALLMSESFVATEQQVFDKLGLPAVGGGVGQWHLSNDNQWIKTAIRAKRCVDGTVEHLAQFSPPIVYQPDAIALVNRALKQHLAVIDVYTIALSQTQSLLPVVVSYVVLNQQLLNDSYGDSQGDNQDKNAEQLLYRHLGLYKLLCVMPSQLVVVEYLPKHSDGSVDVSALPVVQLMDDLQSEYVAPSNETENVLCALWQQLLDCKNPVGINDNFFALGGHSLIATRLISSVRDRFEVEMPLKILFESPTVAAMAAYISRAQQGEESQFVLPSISQSERFDGDDEQTEEFEF